MAIQSIQKQGIELVTTSAEPLLHIRGLKLHSKIDALLRVRPGWIENLTFTVDEPGMVQRDRQFEIASIAFDIAELLLAMVARRNTSACAFAKQALGIEKRAFSDCADTRQNLP